MGSEQTQNKGIQILSKGLAVKCIDVTGRFYLIGVLVYYALNGFFNTKIILMHLQFKNVEIAITLQFSLQCSLKKGNSISITFILCILLYTSQEFITIGNIFLPKVQGEGIHISNSKRVNIFLFRYFNYVFQLPHLKMKPKQDCISLPLQSTIECLQ